MQQPCPRCGYVSEQLSDRPVRFCRQCGAPLVAESDVTAAETRNYGQPVTNEQFANRPYTPRWAAPAEPPPETTRFYQAPPLQPAYGQPPAPKKSRAGLWLLIAFLSLLLVGGTIAGIAALVLKSTRVEMVHSGKPRSDSSQETETKTAEESSASDEALGGKEELPESLQKYFYPGAEVTSSVEAMGQKIVEMKTDDELDKVGAFYRKLLGAPAIINRGKNGHYMWQVEGSPGTMINVDVDQASGKSQINVIHSDFIPKIK